MPAGLETCRRDLQGSFWGLVPSFLSRRLGCLSEFKYRGVATLAPKLKHLPTSIENHVAFTMKKS